MPDVSALEAYTGQIAEAAAMSGAASAKQHQYIHGDADSFVHTESGPVPTIAMQARLSAKQTEGLEGRLADPEEGPGLVMCYEQRSLESELGDVSIPITRFGAIGNWDGKNGFNNKDALKRAFANVKDNQSIYVPPGDFLVDVTDADLTDLGFGRDYAFILISGKTSVVFSGPGRIHFRCSRSTRRAVFMVFKNCYGCPVIGVNLTSDLVKKDAVPSSEIGVGMGFMFYNCVACGISMSIIRHTLVPWWFTGQPISPPTRNDTSKECYVTNSTFDNFDQNSTYGAGASGLRVTNNTFIDCYTAFKISQHPTDPSFIGAAGRILFANNLVYWRPEAKFQAVFFEPKTAYPAAGVVVESWGVDVLLADNIIDFSGITPPSLPLYGSTAPILIFAGINQKRITIQGGQLIAKAGYAPEAVKSSANVTSLAIHGVRHIGSLRIFLPNLGTEVGGDLTIKGNIGQGDGNTPVAIVVQNGRWDNVDISGNSLSGVEGVETDGDMELLYLTGLVSKTLTVKGNTLPNGKISNYGSPAVTSSRLSISTNTVKAVSLSTVGVLTASLTGNDAVTKSTAFELIMDAATKSKCSVAFSGNSAMGPDGEFCTSAFKLNGGKVRMGGNALHAVSGSAFVFDPSVNIMGGDYFGSGAPSQSAVTGTTYNDFSAGAGGTWLKTTASGATGWKKIVTG